MSLIRAAKVFNFIIPEWLDDDVAVGKICGVAVHAGEVRRLSAAIQAQEEDTEPNPDDQIILDLLKGRRIIEAIRHRRLITNEQLNEAKDYVEAIGARHGLRRRDTSTPYGAWEWA